MKKYLYIIIVLQIAFLNNFRGQDMQYTQLYASSLYLNPAFAGSNVCSRLTLTYRNQWPGINTTYSSYMLSLDHYVVNKNFGIGLLVARDQSGTGVLTTDCINPIFAYQTNINRKVGLRFGLQPGMTIKSLNVNRTTFGDQIIRGGNVTTIETLPQNKTFFDAGAGVLLSSSKFWLGASFYHFNRPNESLIRAVKSKLPTKYCVQGGYRFDLAEDEKTNFKKNGITVAFNYKGQDKFDQCDIGLYLKESNINFGLWYRGLPGFKAYKPGYQNHDAVAFILGIETDRFNVGYSYDYTISKLKSVSNGAHELTISYQLCKLKKKKRKSVIVFCPKF